MSTVMALGRREPETLAGAQCQLRPFKEEQISERYIHWLNDPEVNQFLEVRLVHQTRETALAYVRSFYGATEKYIWGIYPSDGQDLIGTATLHHINRHHGFVENGLLIGEKRYWGKGISEEAMALMVQYAFQTLGLRRVIGGTYATNYGMNFTYKRLGFTCEGRSRQAFVVGPGVYVDAYHWGMLAEDWQTRQRPRVSQMAHDPE